MALDPGFAAYEQHQLHGAAMPINGISSFVWVPVGAQTNAVGTVASTNVLADNGEREVVILGMRVRIAYTNPALDNPATLGLEFLRQAAGSSISSVEESTFRKWVVTDGTRQIFDWSFPWHQNQAVDEGDPIAFVEGGPIMSMPYIFVPAGSVFSVSVSKITGGAATWPAGTEARLSAFAISCPKGMRPPCM
jgi:hypothetical protein